MMSIPSLLLLRALRLRRSCLQVPSDNALLAAWPHAMALLLSLAVCTTAAPSVLADDDAGGPTPTAGAQDDSSGAAADDTAADSGQTQASASSSGSSGGSSSAKGAAGSKKPKYPPFDKVLGDAKKHEGLINLYRKDNKLYAELKSSHFNKDLIVLISIARGIGQGAVLGGMSWGFGDDWIWQFRKTDDDRVLIVRRNVRFTANKGSPEERAVKLSYTDSTLFSLPIVTKSPAGGWIVDLTPVFMSDLPQISRALPGFSLSAQKSSWAETKTFDHNVEIEVAATYASSGSRQFDTVSDSRGVTVNVHYSISRLPSTGYKPRLADDRVGYFLTVIKDFSREGKDDRFVRYINRWHLEKADPKAKQSPPKVPIRFYLEKTIPFKYRKPIREGIEEWNKAFEKAGFVNAIEVVQQQADDNWDPEDIRYNTFRWITAGAGFAMGPSRVNPTTGQILDADIIFDADFIQFWKREYETFTPDSIAALTGGPLDLQSYQQHIRKHGNQRHVCQFHNGMSYDLAMGWTALANRYAAASPEMQERMIQQGLKHIAMHEVGHTLGLRHNFKASTVWTLDEMNDPDKAAQHGTVGSVMDYSPANIVPKGVPQGPFYSPTIGPYDIWAIRYGYTPLSGGTTGEVNELKKIAAEAAKPEYTFATDEDARGIDPDPLVNRFDLGKDPLQYARRRTDLIEQLWPGLVDDVVEEGEGYQRARQAFGVLLANYGRAVYFASRFIGGLYVHRHHKGDEGAKPPFVVVDPERQREAMKLLEERIFNDKPFQFPPELYNHLAASHWSHWGTLMPLRSDYAVHDVIAMWQDRILNQLLSPLTLERLHDSELKVASDQDAFTAAELIERLTRAIFAEVDQLQPGDYTNRKPAISSLRRNLQRHYLKRLSAIAMGNSFAPQDCQTVAYFELEALANRIDGLLKRDLKLDTYTKAHLVETSRRIRKVLEAELELSRP